MPPLRLPSSVLLSAFAAAGLWTLALLPDASAEPMRSGGAMPLTQVAAPATSQVEVRYRTMQIDGLDLFYREAGPSDAPAVLLLHGFPASSFMYRNLIEQLAGRFRVLAPDYPGFGYSTAPSIREFAYTFDHLADIVEKFTDQLGLRRYAIYMQDF